MKHETVKKIWGKLLQRSGMARVVLLGFLLTAVSVRFATALPVDYRTTEFLIANDVGGPSDIDGNVVVYTLSTVREGFDYIGGYNIVTEEHFHIGGQVGPKEFYDTGPPTVDGKWVVWAADAEERRWYHTWYILAENLETGEQRSLTSEPYVYDRDDLGSPDVSGDYVVWSDGDVWFYHIPTEGVTQVTDGPDHDGGTTISYPWMAWVNQSARGAHIQLYNIETSEITTPTAGLGGSQGAPPDASGGFLVWQTSREVILGLNLDSSEIFTVTNGWPDWIIAHVHTDGDTVVWRAAEIAGEHDNIYAYDIATAETFTVTTAAASDRDPCVSGSVVVWSRYARSRNEWDLYGARILRYSVFLPLVLRETGPTS